MSALFPIVESSLDPAFVHGTYIEVRVAMARLRNFLDETDTERSPAG